MKKNYNYLSMPYKTFNFDKMRLKYKKLNTLKSVLDFDEDKETDENLIFNLVSEHNYNEFYLLEYIINKTIYAPVDVKVQNFLLSSLYNSPKAYRKQYQVIKEAYKSDYIFKNFANSIKEDLCLQDKHNCKLFNYQIFEICSKYITNETILEPIDVHLNLHFMQKWIFEQTNLKLDYFTDVEKEIIYYLANGYSAHELTEKDLIKGEKDKNFLNSIIHEILPVKCDVETINQVMAIYCCCNPNPKKIEPLIPRGMEKFKEMIQNGHFNDFL